jgi:WD40 repeat protein
VTIVVLALAALGRLSASATPAPTGASGPLRVTAVLGDGVGRLEGTVSAVALSRDARVGAVGGTRGVEVFSVPELRRLRMFPDLVAHGHGLALSSDGTRVIASARTSKGIQIRDVKDGRVVASFAPACEVDAAAFSRDDRLLAVGGSALGIELWDVASKRARWQKLAGGANGTVQSLAFSSDGRRLLSGAKVDIAGGGGEVSEWFDSPRVWDVDSGAQLVAIDEGRSLAAFSGDERFIIGAGGAVAQVWRNGGGEDPIAELAHFPDRKKSGQWITGVGLSADGAHAYTTGDDGALVDWNVATKREAGRVAAHPEMIEALAVSADGRWGLTGGRDGSGRLWDLARLRRVDTGPGHQGVVIALEVSSDGTRLYSAFSDGGAIEWDVARGAPRGAAVRWDPVAPALGGWSNGQGRAAFAAAGATLVGVRRDRIFAVERASGRMLWQQKNADVGRLPVPTVGAGAALVAGTIVDITSGKTRIALPKTGAFQALSPDARVVAVGTDDGELWLADARTGAELRRLPGHGPSRSYLSGTGFVTNPHAGVDGGAFRGDGALLMTSGWDHTLRFWDVASGALRGTVALSQASSPPQALAFSPDGSWAAVAEEETGLLRIVDGRMLREIAVLDLRRAPGLDGVSPRALAIAPDGHTIYVGTARGAIVVVARG